MKPWLLYGAYGFTGRLIAAEAAARGERPVLAGRDPERLAELAGSLGLEWRAFALPAPRDVEAGLEGVGAVLNAAGPFGATARPLVEACLTAGIHYLDVTGEIAVLEWIASRHRRATEAGVVLLPAVGFDTVPTDCAAARAVSRVPGARRLEIAFTVSGPPSRGTVRSTIARLDRPALERHRGEIREVPAEALETTIPFSDRPRPARAIAWGDVATAYRSTGVGNVRTYMAGTPRGLRALRLLGRAGPALAATPLRGLLDRAARAFLEGPDPEELRTGWSLAWARASGDGGEAAAELRTPNAYAHTAHAAVEATVRVLEGRVGGPERGVLTPSTAFGDGFAAELPGVTWVTPSPGPPP